jgi:hypothetical protein
VHHRRAAVCVSSPSSPPTPSLYQRSGVRVRTSSLQPQTKGLFGLQELKFNSHHINVPSNTWSTKYRLIACMLAQIRSNLRDESIKPN